MARSTRKVSSESTFLRELAAIDASPAGVLWALATEIAGTYGVVLAADSPLGALALPALSALPGAGSLPAIPQRPVDADGSDADGCDLLGRAYEYLVTPDDRRERGVHFTPTSVADTLARLVMPGGVVTVCDPACGGGALLLAAARNMHRSGAMRPVIVQHLYGCDVDPLAAAVTDAALTIWGRGHRPDVVVADGLSAENIWSTDLFDVVIGNPPFLSQLGLATARTKSQRHELTARFGNVAKGYSDTAALFFMRGMQLAKPFGRVGMILPESIATIAAADNLRSWVSQHGDLELMWLPGQNLFDAQVRVCVPVVVVGEGSRAKSVQVRVGTDAESGSSVTLSKLENWSELTASAQGIPMVTFPFTSTNTAKLGDVATCTADFRDQYYGLIPYVVDAQTTEPRPGFAPLISVGLIDLGGHQWGKKAVKFGGGTFARPVVDVDRLTSGDPKLGAWARGRMVPKILVATQTKIVEAVVDEHGDWLPSVPVLSVIPHDAAAIWRVLAVLAHPMVSAWLAQRSIGSGLSASTMRLRANQLAEIPLPAVDEIWERAARAAQNGDWRALARVQLYGQTTNAVASWWATHIGG